MIVFLVIAVVVRIAVRIAFGESYFWKNSYSGYYQLAELVLHGKGLCFDTTCAWWPPIYPLFLALTGLFGKHYLLIVIPQALIGAGTTLCAFLIGRQIFNQSVGVLACAITVVYPYYVMHDTALQETGLVTLLVALSVYLLLRAGNQQRLTHWFLSGLVLGLIALTRASTAPLALAALLWIVVWGVRDGIKAKLLPALVVVVALLVSVGPWLIRTYRITGAAVLTSQTGRALWIGNNPQTFSEYPMHSIDLSTGNAMTALSSDDRMTLDRLKNNEIASSDWYRDRALVFISANKMLTLKHGIQKVAAAFSWRLNPVRDWVAQTSYALFYIPVALLGFIGMIINARKPGVVLILLYFVTFICVTAVFWAHTSHRSFLDVYLIVLAASVIERAWRVYRRASDLSVNVSPLQDR